MALVRNKDKNGEIASVEQMLKKFKKQVEREGIMQDLKKHEFFVPKSIKKAEKRARHQKMLRKLGK